MRYMSSCAYIPPVVLLFENSLSVLMINDSRKDRYAREERRKGSREFTLYGIDKMIIYTYIFCLFIPIPVINTTLMSIVDFTCLLFDRNNHQKQKNDIYYLIQ